jgi:hypothetical protein
MPARTLVAVEVPSLEGVETAADGELLELLQQWTEARRVVDAGLAVLAGQVAARSRVDLGYNGLAQRSGDRTPDALVSRLTGASGAEAGSLVAVGRMMDAPPPWLAPVASGVASGRISVGAADAIRRGLGDPSSEVAADDLVDAARELTGEAASLPPEKIARRARELRDELDATGVGDRERQLREKRFLRLLPQGDGMTRLLGLLDPESAAIVANAVDRVTSPRRGGPRFVDPGEAERARGIEDDRRTTEQLSLDALVEMVRIAGAADDGRVFGAHKPSVQVHVSVSDLASDESVAWIEGQAVATSVATARRIACADGYLPILFDEGGQPIRLGRSQRLFSAAQRTALAARWGGCPVPGCDRPASWTEAHHIDEWKRDHGATDVEDGILLCRHHHMLVHNNGWRVRRRGNDYELIPPPGDTPHPRPIPLESKNPVYRRARSAATPRSRRAPTPPTRP